MSRNNPRLGYKYVGWLTLAMMLVSVGLTGITVSPVSADLPPRPATPTPVWGIPVPAKLVGGWIQVQVSNVTTQSVTVQWQDVQGTWNEVTSWRGQFDTIENGVGVKTWWVDQSLFGAPNFRWVVLDSKGQVLMPSPVFTLPTENKQTIVVQVSLAP